MKKILESISLKLRFTKIEVKTLIFVFCVFIFGLIVNYGKLKIIEKPKRNFSYSFHDSLFKAIENKKSAESESSKKKEKRVDSKAELSDFSNKKLVSKKERISNFEEFSININEATEKVLTKLPGIGPKTAAKIVALRQQKNGFNSLKDLLDVKGIGTKKLNKIKKYLYLEK